MGYKSPVKYIIIELTRFVNTFIALTRFMEVYMTTFHEKLTYIRKKNGWTKKYVAEKIGVHPSTIGNLEDESIPQSDLLYELSRLFNVSMEYFMNPNIEEIEFTQVHNNPLSSDEQRILSLFSQLNDTEKLEIIKIMELKLSLKKDALIQTSSISEDKLRA